MPGQPSQYPGQRGFCTLIAADAARLQAITAAASLGVVQRQTEIVAAEEPFQPRLFLDPPGGLAGQFLRGQARQYQSLGFDRLLIEAGRVSDSTQNQALSALLFLYRKVLEVDPGRIAGVVGAVRPKRLPVVLTWDEVRTLSSWTGLSR
jgi:hypothetical protein